MLSPIIIGTKTIGAASLRRSTDCFVNGQSPNSYAELTLFLFRLRNEASHKPVGDSGANPNFREKVVGVLVDGKKIDGIVIKRGNDHVNDSQCLCNRCNSSG